MTAFGKVIGLFIGRDGKIPKGVSVPVTGNGRTGSAAKPSVTSSSTPVQGKHAGTPHPGKHAGKGKHKS